jgi:hypothetical protein
MRYFIIALFLIGSASADGLELEFSLMTAHLVTSGMNNNNALIGLSYDNWEASTFINSCGDRSYSASRRFHLNHGFSVSAGAIHGYGDNAKFFYAFESKKSFIHLIVINQKFDHVDRLKK